ncbi:MAG: hypothetical protein JWN76_1322 [Chitinophagaceae bacterium]|nr:hypothetical protein [Chitinophagaceae bacterium]
MKTQSTQLLPAINQNDLDRLTHVVKETVATSLENQAKVFSAADLWKIQRTRKMRVQRRMIA